MKIGYWFMIGIIIFTTPVLSLPVSVIRSVIAIIGFIIAVVSVHFWLVRYDGGTDRCQSKQEAKI